MEKIILPDDVIYILDKLKQNGFESYIVGGCVRDSLLNIPPHDWDITTNATPQQVEYIFKNSIVIHTGIEFGTITLVLNNNNYEITTYRKDGRYSDNRHPDNIEYAETIQEDLQRRDFTINAIAYNGEEYIYVNNSIEDLKNGVIRIVGNNKNDIIERIKDDPLRILRALRFSSKYGFSIDECTSEILKKYSYMLNMISSERIVYELCNTLIGFNIYKVLKEYRDIYAEFIPEIKPMFDFDQCNKWHIYDVWEHTIRSISYCNKNLICRLALLFHDIGKPQCYIDHGGNKSFRGHPLKSSEICYSIMRRLKFSKYLIDTVNELVLHHDDDIICDERSVKRIMNKIGKDNTLFLIEIQRSDKMSQNRDKKEVREYYNCIYNIYSDILDKEKCFTLKDLDINGNDIMEYFNIPSSKKIGDILKYILDNIIENNIKNDREDIINFIKNKGIINE